MAARRSEKNCFESQYGGGWISAHQRLAEMACERIAGENTLGARFWTQKRWLSVFRREATHASRLLSVPFTFEAIRRALVSPRGRRVQTLGAPFFREMIQTEQRKLDVENQRLETVPLPEPINTLEKPRPLRRHGKSVREKLTDAPTQRGLFDNDSEEGQ